MNTLPFRPTVPAVSRADEITVAEVVRLYLEDCDLRHKSRQLADGTLTNTRRYLAAFVQTYGDQSISLGHRSDLTRWLLLNSKTWLSDCTKGDAVGRVVACFKWAEDEGLISRNPYVRPRSLRFNRRPRPAIEWREYRAIIRETLRRQHGGKGIRKLPSARHFRRAVRFLARTGARPCEMRAARFDQVRWDDDPPSIWQVEHKTARATGEDRVIGLGQSLVRLLRWLWQHKAKGQDVVFTNSRGTPWTKDTFAKLFRSFARKAGVRPAISAACLRHGFTVRGLEKGIGERQLADQLGHKTTRMVSWYGRQTRLRSQHLRNVVDQVMGT